MALILAGVKNTQDPSQPAAMEKTTGRVSAVAWGSLASVRSLGNPGNLLWAMDQINPLSESGQPHDRCRGFQEVQGHSLHLACS